MFELNNRVAIVTGASSGLGADAARAYAEAGANVAILARRKEKLLDLEKEIEATGRNVISVKCDVTCEESVKSAVKEVIDKFGKVDILLNNAGVAVMGGVDTLTVDEWNKSMNTNVKGIFLLCKYVIPEMIKNNYGKIVNIGSVNAIRGDKADIFMKHSYNASKGAVLGLSTGMAATYGKYGITVNTVCPGLFESEMTENNVFKSKESLSAHSAKTPLNRLAKKGELSGTVLYFSSDASSYVTGQYVAVDGGVSIV